MNAHTDEEPGELLDRMAHAIDEFTGEAPLFDDTTMMCLWYRGKPE